MGRSKGEEATTQRIISQHQMNEHQKLCWCICYVAHKVPGWCFCELDRSKRESFMCEKAALKEQSDNRDVQRQLQRVSDPRPLESNRRVPMLGVLERGSWIRTPLSPKTPALNEEAPLQTRMDLFSSLI